MGNTVLMRKGDTFADIFDSPQTIVQAQRDGYHVCSETEIQLRKEIPVKSKKQPEPPKEDSKPKGDNAKGGEAGK
jgi:hypothetical protein